MTSYDIKQLFSHCKTSKSWTYRLLTYLRHRDMCEKRAPTKIMKAGPLVHWFQSVVEMKTF